MKISLAKASQVTGINIGTMKRHIEKGLLYAEQKYPRRKIEIDVEDLAEYWLYIFKNSRCIMYPPSEMDKRIYYYVYGIWL
jgi:hypothetical protein